MTLPGQQGVTTRRASSACTPGEDLGEAVATAEGRRVHRIRLFREQIRNIRLQRLQHSSRLPPVNRHATFWGMYVVTEADAAAIREAYETGGELSAAVELRRRFPGIVDNATAREQARRIAAWTALPPRAARRRRGKADAAEG
jgi:hypothetical protein